VAIKEGGARFEEMNIGGSSNMPAFAGILTGEEILAVLEYVKSTWPENVRALQQQQMIQNTSS
jgi:mono/diheme cytochrome c family protein